MNIEIEILEFYVKDFKIGDNISDYHIQVIKEDSELDNYLVAIQKKSKLIFLGENCMDVACFTVDSEGGAMDKIDFTIPIVEFVYNILFNKNNGIIKLF